jgi:hypothetical protein
MVADPANEEGEAPGGVVVERGDDLGHVEWCLAQVDQLHRGMARAHVPTLAIITAWDCGGNGD